MAVWCDGGISVARDDEFYCVIHNRPRPPSSATDSAQAEPLLGSFGCSLCVILYNNSKGVCVFRYLTQTSSVSVIHNIDSIVPAADSLSHYPSISSIQKTKLYHEVCSVLRDNPSGCRQGLGLCAQVPPQ